jgi:hypothetical protein
MRQVMSLRCGLEREMSRGRDRAAEKMNDDVHAKLEAAFRNSDLDFSTSPTSKRAISLAVGVLAYFSTYQESSLSQFRKVGRVAAKKELDDLALAAEKLTKRLEALSATAINALGGRHIMNPIARQTDYLRDLATVVRDADVNSAPDAVEKGRPANERATYVASIIIGAFESITGHNADLPANRDKKRTHGLLPLAREIFPLLGIKCNAKAAVEAALESDDPLVCRGRSLVAALAVGKKERKSHAPMHGGTIAQSAKDLFERMRLTELDERSPRNWKRRKNTSLEDH